MLDPFWGFYLGYCIGWGIFCMVMNKCKHGYSVDLHHQILVFILNGALWPFAILSWLYRRYLNGKRDLGWPIIYILE